MQNSVISRPEVLDAYWLKLGANKGDEEIEKGWLAYPSFATVGVVAVDLLADPGRLKYSSFSGEIIAVSVTIRKTKLE